METRIYNIGSNFTLNVEFRAGEVIIVLQIENSEIILTVSEWIKLMQEFELITRVLKLQNDAIREKNVQKYKSSIDLVKQELFILEKKIKEQGEGKRDELFSELMEKRKDSKWYQTQLYGEYMRGTKIEEEEDVVDENNYDYDEKAAVDFGGFFKVEILSGHLRFINCIRRFDEDDGYGTPAYITLLSREFNKIYQHKEHIERDIVKNLKYRLIPLLSCDYSEI